MPNPPTGFQHGITLDQAMTIAQATLAEGRRLNLAPLTVVVLDGAGRHKALLREDGSSLLRPDIAHGKAFGAMGLGLGGQELAKRATAMQGFMNAYSDLAGGAAVPVPGGVLIRDAVGGILGAVGVTGDTSANDEACALAGIAAVGLTTDTGA